MASGHFRMDLAVVRQGLDVLFGFGLRPLEEMVTVAELLEHSVYEHGSLACDGPRATFVLLNPPLRMGAFHSATLLWDGAPVPSQGVRVRPGGSAETRAFSDLTRERPVTLPIGERTRFWVEGVPLDPGAHRVRLELFSVAIPPRVWFEFTDRLAPDTPR